MKKLLIKKTVINTLVILTLYSPPSLALASKTNINYDIKNQPIFIKKIINKEKRIKHYKKLISIIEYIDLTYKNLYLKLYKSKKLTIFIDPAHGKLKNGKWQGAVTWRKSCTGRPEEFYSILLARRLYRLISQNPYLEIKSTPDFMQVLRNETNTYKNIPFSKTIQLAKKAGAFIIISEHLNNISPRLKAGGVISLSGIHVTCTKFGRSILTDVKSVHKGFLTLYNKLDASGLSLNYAQELKLALLKKGLSPGTWGQGTVADDRFTYFINYPISVIYESAFISNPQEENMLRTDPEYRQNIVVSQYHSLIRSIDNIFGVDLSTKKPVKTNNNNNRVINRLKLSRILIYYIQTDAIEKSISLCKLFIKKYKYRIDSPTLKAYQKIKKTLTDIKKNLELAQKNRSRKRYKKASKYFKKALKKTWHNPLFYAINHSIKIKYRKIVRHLPRRNRIKIHRRHRQELFEPVLPIYATFKMTAEKHKTSIPFILTIEGNQSLKGAIDSALAPKDRFKTKIYKAFKKIKIKKYKSVRYYSKKRKRYYWRRQKITKKITFKKGIYIVKLNKKFKIVNVKKVHSVAFNPGRYQNQQYFKNSCLAEKIKKKSL